MRFKRPEIICENCLARFEFTESDIHGDLGEEYELFVTCPYCDEEIEIESVEDYGFWPEDILNGVESEDED
jgi:hypothetical protein